jgi:hypothetical protein
MVEEVRILYLAFVVVAISDGPLGVGHLILVYVKKLLQILCETFHITITDMAVRNFDAVSDKFNVFKIHTEENYTCKCITTWYN